MDVIGLVGSPRKKGNTDLLVDQVLAGVATAGLRVQKFYLNDLRIHPCQYCNYCRKHYSCRQEDDMALLYTAIEQCRGIVVGTPTFYGDITAQTKIFIDRCYRYVEVVRHPDGRNSFPSRLPDRRLGMMVGVTGSFGPETFNKQVEVIGLLFNDLNVGFADKVLYAGTDYRPVKENQAILTLAYAKGVEFGKRILNGIFA
ncbi:flavodoxin family protein [Neomoorella glycerini]|uniref:flavodoxin family protein n=1 Tax=Neomoorella glycerini TaxID=55779 RepID=UPI0014780BA6|nr:flavodoxin family protein [Moorella glycerini]